MEDKRPKENCPTCGLRVQTVFEHVDATKTCPVGVVGVAIRYGGKIYSFRAPMRHGDLMKTMVHKGVGEGAAKGEQGFKLSNGKFADRVLAREIAVAAGQVKETIDPKKLYSEDLW